MFRSNVQTRRGWTLDPEQNKELLVWSQVLLIYFTAILIIGYSSVFLFITAAYTSAPLAADELLVGCLEDQQLFLRQSQAGFCHPQQQQAVG
jgi:hypothetical protein